MSGVNNVIWWGCGATVYPNKKRQFIHANCMQTFHHRKYRHHHSVSIHDYYDRWSHISASAKSFLHTHSMLIYGRRFTRGKQLSVRNVVPLHGFRVGIITEYRLKLVPNAVSIFSMAIQQPHTNKNHQRIFKKRIREYAPIVQWILKMNCHGTYYTCFSLQSKPYHLKRTTKEL